MERKQQVFVVDDDAGVREGLSLLLETVGLQAQLFASATEFLEAYNEDMVGCLLLDVRMPRMTGLDLQEKLRERGSSLPIIFITGHGDIPMAVEAMRRGAIDFIRKPFREQDLLDRINEALAADLCARRAVVTTQQTLQRVASLTAREYDVFEGVAEGKMNKVIGHELGISERTVEVHRSQVMKKLGVKTLAQLVRVKIETERDSIEN
ncbi:MAG: response regulator transcription factor [Halioglobus sp.]|nr:response regulator transcription factor [Halioglobus sp.]